MSSYRLREETSAQTSNENPIVRFPVSDLWVWQSNFFSEISKAGSDLRVARDGHEGTSPQLLTDYKEQTLSRAANPSEGRSRLRCRPRLVGHRISPYRHQQEKEAHLPTGTLHTLAEQGASGKADASYDACVREAMMRPHIALEHIAGYSVVHAII